MVRHALSIALSFLVLEATAWAQVTVVVLEQMGQEPRHTFVQALRIQLGDIATVVEGGRLPAGTLSARVEHAAAAVAEVGGTFALWLDEAGGGDFVLHVVGRRAGRAVVEIVRMPAAADGPETDRALAIKAREVIEEILAPSAPDEPARALRPAPPSMARPARPKTALSSHVEVGVVAAGGTIDPQGGLAIAAALRLSCLVACELYGTARFVSGVTRADERGEITLGEQSGGVGIRVLGAGRIGVGGAVEIGARWLHVEASTPAGTMGSISDVLPTMSAGPELRLHLRPGVELRTAVAAEVGLWRQRFALNGEPVLDLGRWRALGTMSLLVVFP